jgi:flagellar motility protein MotE (MotC chaperone)
MIRRFRQRLYRLCTPALLCAAALVPCVGPARANEDGVAAEARQVEAKQPQVETKLQGVRQVPLRKPALAPIKPLAVDGMKGVENFCGAIAASAASARLAWQEQRIRALEAELLVKTAELDVKAAEVRQWVQKREQLLAKASDNLTAIYAKMKPEAAAAEMQAMDDEEAAALLAKLKPAVAGAVMSEMDPARAARLGEVLSAARSDEKKS